MNDVFENSGAATGSTSDLPATTPTGAGDEAVIPLLKAIVNNLFYANNSYTADGGANTLDAPDDVQAFTLTANDMNLNNHMIEFTIATIDTSVDITMEGDTGSGNFTQLSADGLDTQYTTNGTYHLRISGVPLDAIRLIMKAEVGGTAVVISDINYIGSR